MYYEVVTASVQQGADAAALIQLSRLIQAVFARVADRHELPPMRARLLCVLAESSRGMAELAREFGVEKPHSTTALSRSARGRHGLVERRGVPGDRRATSVALTPAGLRTATRFHADVTAELDQLTASLTAAEGASFRIALATIIEAAGLCP